MFLEIIKAILRFKGFDCFSKKVSHISWQLRYRTRINLFQEQPAGVFFIILASDFPHYSTDHSTLTTNEKKIPKQCSSLKTKVGHHFCHDPVAPKHIEWTHSWLCSRTGISRQVCTSLG